MINTQHKKQQQHGKCSPRMLKFSTALLGMCLAGYIVGPPLYWHISESVNSSVTNQTSCPSCHCDCLDQPLFSLHQGLNASFLTGCMKHDSDEAGEESDKNYEEILSGELRQKEAETLANQQHADIALLEAKKMANQYQKDADKCNNGMETCEDARERAEDALDAQRELTAMWEMRARHRGWKPELSEGVDKLPEEEARSLENSNNQNAEATSFESNNLVHDTEAEAGSNVVQDTEAEAGSNAVQDTEAEAGRNVVQDTEAEAGSNVVPDTEAEAGSNVVQDVRAESFEDSTKIPDAVAESLDKVQNAEAESESLDTSNKAEDTNAEAFENGNKAQDAEAESHTETIATE